MIHTAQHAREALATYTHCRSPDYFEVVPDPMITGVWAGRDRDGNHFLIHASEEVEEVEYKEWPPHATI